MIEEEKKVYDILNKMDISYERIEHRIYETCNEADVDMQGLKGLRTKNLFLKNKKKTNFYLVIMDDKKHLNLKKLANALEDKNLTFASEEELMEYLKLQPGSVSVFGLLNDRMHAVKVVLSQEVYENEYITSHPNVGTATISTKVTDMLQFIKSMGNQIINITVIN